MKFRLASHDLSALLHRSTHIGHRRRSHEGIFRVVQLVLMVLFALFCAKMIAGGAVMAMRAIGGFVS